MTSTDDWKKTVRLNKLLGMWAAEKLGITGEDAEAYSDALAVGTLDPERSDVLGKIRKLADACRVRRARTVCGVCPTPLTGRRKSCTR